MPGVLSIELRRPSQERQLFFGPYDDVDVGPDTYLPLMNRSEICAPCHSASFWGVEVYRSFDEWLDSPYADENVTCQDCHMAPDNVTTNFAPGRGGVERDPATVPTHGFPGVDEGLLRDTAEVAVNAQIDGGLLVVQVNVTNTGAGHRLPTGSPLRQVLLTVNATDGEGQPLPLRNGSTLPDWAGNLAGEPGMYFAKIMEQLWTETYPTGAYWTQTRIREDTRLPARETSTSRYVFEARGDEAEVETRLVFRRAYHDLVQQKGWDTPDIPMEHAVVKVKR